MYLQSEIGEDKRFRAWRRCRGYKQEVKRRDLRSGGKKMQHAGKRKGGH